MFEPEVFRKQMPCIEESTCDIVGTFRCPPQSFAPPAVIQRPGYVPPIVTPLPAGQFTWPAALISECVVAYNGQPKLRLRIYVGATEVFRYVKCFPSCFNVLRANMSTKTMATKGRRDTTICKKWCWLDSTPHILWAGILSDQTKQGPINAKSKWLPLNVPVWESQHYLQPDLACLMKSKPQNHPSH